MSEQPKETLKSYFQSGDKPTEANFADLIDTMVSPTDLAPLSADITKNKEDIVEINTIQEDMHSFILACSAETGEIPTGEVFTFRMPYGFILVDIRGSLNSPPASGSVKFNLTAGGQAISSLMEMTTVTTGANTLGLLGENAPALSIPRETEIKVNVSSAPYGATGLKITLVGKRGHGIITLQLAPINFDPNTGLPISFYNAVVE